MPFYEISHTYPLTPADREALAKGITSLHCTTFNTPSLFVNILFSPIKGEEYWYGGKRKTNSNRVFAHVRGGSSRTSESFAKLAKDLEAIWDNVVGKKESDVGPGNLKILQAIFIIPGITAREEGLAIPQVSWFMAQLCSGRILTQFRLEWRRAGYGRTLTTSKAGQVVVMETFQTCFQR
jgi:phenylpyruvate tautomerase PptA (4-oxalocrotonate tautomerase family)